MTEKTLQRFFTLKKSIHVYLRDMPTAAVDNPALWWGPKPQA
jgi:hypothetical protein